MEQPSPLSFREATKRWHTSGSVCACCVSGVLSVGTRGITHKVIGRKIKGLAGRLVSGVSDGRGHFKSIPLNSFFRRNRPAGVPFV